MEVILTPPVAFLIYLPLTAIILWLGRILAGPGKSSEIKSSLYSSGEEAPTSSAAPGYRPFFLVAFFFAILHLGILILGTGTLSYVEGLYLFGILMALVALILG